MDKQTIEQLKILETIKPNESFKEISRRVVLAHEPKRTPSFFPKIAFATTLAVVLVGFITFNNINSGPNVASLDQEDINNEIAESFQIAEIEYRQNVNDTIASALTEVSRSSGNHLNSSVIRSEHEFIGNENINRDKEVNELLNQIIF